MSYFRRHIGAEGFFGHIIACCGVSPAPAPAAHLPVAADTALTFQRAGIPHSCEVFTLVPNIHKLLLEDVAALDGQIAAWKDIPLMPDEEDSKPGQAAFGWPTMPAPSGDGAASLRTRFLKTFLPDNTFVMRTAGYFHLQFTAAV